MWIFILQNWKLVLVGVLVLALAGVAGAYSWQRGNLVKAKADLADMTAQKEAAVALTGVLRKNLEDAKAHVQRVEVIKYRDRIVTEVVTITVPADVPIIPPVIVATPEEKEVCKRYAEREEKNRVQMVAVQDAATLITDYYNGMRSDEDYNKIRAKVLSQTNAAGATASPVNAKPAP
jgi:hypothetical protein